MKLHQYYFGVALIAVASISSALADDIKKIKTQNNKVQIVTMDVIARTPYLSNILQDGFSNDQKFTIKNFTTSGINIRNKDGSYSQNLVPVLFDHTSPPPPPPPKVGDKKSVTATVTDDGLIFRVEYGYTFMKRRESDTNAVWVLTSYSRVLIGLEPTPGQEMLE